jgi:hypothetical protein
MFQALKDGINRRRHVRRTLDAAGVLQWPDGGNDVRCILEDISLGGARLRLEGPADLPRFSCLLCRPTRLTVPVRWLGKTANGSECGFSLVDQSRRNAVIVRRVTPRGSHSM